MTIIGSGPGGYVAAIIVTSDCSVAKMFRFLSVSKAEVRRQHSEVRVRKR